MQLQTLSGWLGRGAVLPSADSLASEQLSVPARHSSGGHQGAAVAIGGYRWLQVATGGYRWLQVAAGGYRWLQVATGGYKGDQGSQWS